LNLIAGIVASVGEIICAPTCRGLWRQGDRIAPCFAAL
jgi:hypothetical protein